MKQNRRNFLKKLPLAMSIPFTIGGIPLKVMADNKLSKLAAKATSEGRVLIILQMHGGNDGLNTLIPIDQYELYYSKRPNLAIPANNGSRKYIPLDSTLDLGQQVGLHPDMQAVKAMYDTGRVAFIQGVSYENNNGSHFRGRDINFMGGTSEDYFSSGWLGRYINYELAVEDLKYPDNFPNETMPDPLAIEMGSDVSLIFHQEGNIPMSISVEDPEYFAQLVSELEGFIDQGIDPRGIPPEFLAQSNYYNELQWILSLEDKSKSYAERLFTVWKDGKEGTVTYPEKYPFNAPKGSAENMLSAQLKLIARLLAGNCKTKLFLVKLGGFDTHAGQVESYDTTMGSHAALLYHLSSAMKSFQDDLRARGLEDRVLTVTTSEFGRRIESNGSYGTDHGNAGPMMIFGRGANPGVVGVPPDLTQDNRNVTMQEDYRNVYASIMKNWMGVPEADLQTIFPDLQFKELNIAQQNITGVEGFVSSRFSLEECYPNPAQNKTTVHFKVNAANHVTVELVDLQGQKIKVLVNEFVAPGEYKREVELDRIKTGAYFCQLRSGSFKQSRKLVIVP
jgi:uncharacterized protein (DUF1501 family)